MNVKKRSRPLLIFYLLVAYVFVQFFWWTYLLLDLNREALALREQLLISEAFDDAEVKRIRAEYKDRIRSRNWMIAGEGAVFVLLMVFGIMRVRNTFKKESELNARQKNFLLSITHELKSPIASSRLQLETLLKRELPREKQQELVANALADTERLNKLVENILLAARIDNKSVEAHREDTAVSELLGEIAEQVRMIYLPRQRMETDIAGGVRLMTDKTYFHSIVFNLLENAIKYSPPGSLIRIMLREDQNRVTLSVADEGPGIPADEKERIFGKFYRIGNEETRSAKGTGLGLYIVKNLAEKLGASVSVKDNTPGGAVFEVSFEK
ncbi:MAG: ATP-binding protein [Bacteroidota bacterium]